MRKQDRLISLIQALSPSEKKYFAQYAAMGGNGKSYLKLYESLQGAKNYDADTLSKKLDKKKADLANEKKYLERVLLKALRNKYEENSPRLKLNTLLSETELLEGRKLYQLSISKAENAILECMKYEQFDYALRFIRHYQSAYLASGKGWCSTRMTTLFESVMEKAANENEYRLLIYRFTHLINQESFPQRKTKTGALEELLCHPLLKNENKALSATAKILFCRIWGEYYMRKTPQVQKAIALYLKAIRILQSNANLLNLFSRDYLFMHGAVVSLYLGKEAYTHAAKTMHRAKAWLDKKQNHFSQVVFAEATAYIHYWNACISAQSGDFKSAILVIENFHESYLQLLLPANRYILQFLLCQSYFFENDMHNALKAYHHSETTNLHQKPLSFYWVNHHLYLLIQYALGNHSVLEYQLGGYLRWCRKNKLNDEAFSVFYKMLKEFNSRNTAKDTLSERINYYKVFFGKLDENSEAGRIFSTLEIVKWLKNQIIDK